MRVIDFGKDAPEITQVIGGLFFQSIHHTYESSNACSGTYKHEGK